MKVQIVSRKLIKPSTPTPQNLKTYKISFKDDLSPPPNFGFLLFYESKPDSISSLEQSLSEILPQFYPLAGRFINKDFIVDCSDQGVEFVEAVLLENAAVLTDLSNAGEVQDLLPRSGDQVVGPTDPLLSVQITKLIKCGLHTLSIGVSMSHQIFDASSIGTFIAAWSNINRGGRVLITPSFDAHFLFPGKKRRYYSETKSQESTKIISKRFSFNKESLTKLRSKLTPKQVSKVRIVSAIIAKALIRIDGMKHRQPRPRLIIHAVDMRPRTIPPFPKHSCGNLVLHSVAKSTTDMEIQELVDTIDDAIGKTLSNCAKILSLGEEGYRDMIINPEADLIEGLKSSEVTDLWFSDWSRFGLYDADFGWGKPVAVVVALVPVERVTVLMNNKDGDGIAAWVNLESNDMCLFEEDEDIKSLTT